jgi:HPt (histidine-containing phosphotransfer) domain-containing protein
MVWRHFRAKARFASDPPSRQVFAIRQKVNARLEEAQFTGIYILCVRVHGRFYPRRPAIANALARGPQQGPIMDAAAKVHRLNEAGAATRPEPALDLAHLRRFTLGDHDLELEILDLFITQAPITLAALNAAGTDRDWRIAAHTLKGSARAVGAWSVALLAERAEAMSRRNDPADCEAAARELADALSEAGAFIAALNSAA